MSLSMWAADAVLIGLAYWLGRVHASIRLHGVYMRTLRAMLDEVKAMRAKVDQLNGLYEAALSELRRKGRDRAFF